MENKEKEYEQHRANVINLINNRFNRNKSDDYDNYIQYFLVSFNLYMRESKNDNGETIYTFYNATTNEKLIIENEWKQKSEEISKSVICKTSKLKIINSTSSNEELIIDISNGLFCGITKSENVIEEDIFDKTYEKVTSVDRKNNSFVYTIKNNSKDSGGITSSYSKCTFSGNDILVELKDNNGYRFIDFTLNKDRDGNKYLQVTGNNISIEDGLNIILESGQLQQLIGKIYPELNNAIVLAKQNQFPIKDLGVEISDYNRQ